jgi:hypothetical protein
MSIEAMKQALEALEDHATQYPHMQKGYTVDAITALRTAIEQAEKHDPTGKNYLPVEPVGWMHNQIEGVVITHRPADVDRHPERWERIYKECKA